MICPKRSFEETTNFVKNDILDKELLIMKAIYESFHTSYHGTYTFLLIVLAMYFLLFLSLNLKTNRQ